MLRTRDRIFIIGEVAQTHDGSLGLAHSFIDAIAAAGADAVKFQTHIAAAESTPAEPWRIKFSTQDKTRYDYWKRMEFSEDQWLQLKQHADAVGLEFLSSPFSVEAAELLARVGVEAWKIASGEVNNPVLFEHLLATRLPVYLSTGMSSLSEIDQAVARVQSIGTDLTVLQCTSLYPTPPEKLGLNMIPFFRSRYGCAVGLSDHSGTIYAGLAAAALGIDVLEVHVTLSREMFGPDVPSSLTTSDLSQLVKGARFIETALSHPCEKDAVAEELEPMRRLFTKSVVVTMDLPTGTCLGPQHLASKKPGTGIPAEQLPSLIGRRLKRAVTRDHILDPDDLL